MFYAKGNGPLQHLLQYKYGPLESNKPQTSNAIKHTGLPKTIWGFPIWGGSLSTTQHLAHITLGRQKDASYISRRNPIPKSIKDP